MGKQRVCLIGNSGLACVRKAWEETTGPMTEKVELTFFAASAYTTASLDLEDKALVSSDAKVKEQFFMTSGGHEAIDIKAFDAFLIHGLSFEFRDYLKAFRDFALFADGMSDRVHHLMSGPLHAQLIEDRYAFRPGRRLANLIQNVTDATVVMGPASYPTEAALAEGQAFGPIDPERDREFLERVETRYRQEYKARADANGWRSFVQPAFTTSIPGFTEMRYSNDGIGLPQNVKRALKRGEIYRKARENDPWHLNAEYGAILLDVLFDVLEVGPGRKPAKWQIGGS